MDKFEHQFETLDVQTQQMEDTMSSTTTLITPQVRIVSLLRITFLKLHEVTWVHNKWLCEPKSSLEFEVNIVYHKNANRKLWFVLDSWGHVGRFHSLSYFEILKVILGHMSRELGTWFYLVNQMNKERTW